MWSLIVTSLLVSFAIAGPIDVAKPKDPVANATTTNATTPVVNVTSVNATTPVVNATTVITTTPGSPESTTIVNVPPPNRQNHTTTTKPTSTTSTEPTTTKPTSTTTVTPSTTTTTTPKPESTTAVPVKPTTAPPPTSAPNHDRKFDGPSFIGGIILACGFTAIGFIAFKFYKARTEHNYHTFSTT